MNEPTSTERNKIMSIIKALKAGNELVNAEGWKKAQNWINLAAAGVGIAANFIPGLGAILTPDLVDEAFILLGTVNAYITTATTTRIGL